MYTKNRDSEVGIGIELPPEQLSEDPYREPHEKETAIHTEGDGTHYSVTSFKKVVYEKLLRRPEFQVQRVHVIDEDNRERAFDTIEECEGQSILVIGVTGRMPVGSLSIGQPRNSNSHAEIVK